MLKVEECDFKGLAELASRAKRVFEKPRSVSGYTFGVG
jgi:hypothetical protein